VSNNITDYSHVLNVTRPIHIYIIIFWSHII